jgi:Gp157 protein
LSALSLYEIAQQLQSLESINDAEELPAAVIADTLEALEGSFEVKAVAVAHFILSLESNAAACAAAAEQMEVRALRIEKRAKAIKAYLQFWMEAIRVRKIETPEITLRLQENPPAVVITNEAWIPPQYWVEPEPPPKRIDKKALRTALEGGALIEGAYIERGEHLRIIV